MMEPLIIDASVAIKWMVQEDGTDAALDLRSRFSFIAPDLLIPECSNILRKKVQRGELTRDEAVFASGLLRHADVELVSLRNLAEEMTLLAMDLGHPAYDCAYLSLAYQKQFRFVTADRRLIEVVRRKKPDHMRLCAMLGDEANRL